MGEPLPADLDEALTYFASVARREDVRIEFVLEPGEIMICNNFAVLHARTEFENAPGRERLLLRLWLNVPNGRPIVPELLERARRFDRKYDRWGLIWRSSCAIMDCSRLAGQWAKPL
jgi:hypothetical protein